MSDVGHNHAIGALAMMQNMQSVTSSPPAIGCSRCCWDESAIRIAACASDPVDDRYRCIYCGWSYTRADLEMRRASATPANMIETKATRFKPAPAPVDWDFVRKAMADIQKAEALKLEAPAPAPEDNQLPPWVQGKVDDWHCKAMAARQAKAREAAQRWMAKNADEPCVKGDERSRNAALRKEAQAQAQAQAQQGVMPVRELFCWGRDAVLRDLLTSKQQRIDALEARPHFDDSPSRVRQLQMLAAEREQAMKARIVELERQVSGLKVSLAASFDREEALLRRVEVAPSFEPEPNPLFRALDVVDKRGVALLETVRPGTRL